MSGRSISLVFAAILVAAAPSATQAAEASAPLPPELGIGPELSWQDIAKEAGPKLKGSPLGLAEAIRVAVATCPDVRVAGYDPLVARAELEARIGVYEPHLFADGSASQSVSPSTSALSGGPSLDVRSYAFGGGVGQTVPTGGSLSLKLSNEVENTNSATFAALSPQYTPDLIFSITQPLLKNLFTDDPRTRIRVARTDLQAAEATFRQRIRDIVNETEDQYWDLVFAAEELRVKDIALKLGERLLQNNKLRFEIGVIPETEVISAEAEVARRRDAMVIAELAYRNAQDAFRRATGMDPAGPDIIPSDAIVTPSLEQSLTDWVEQAHSKREEIQAAAAHLQGLEDETRLARNALLPQLDFVGEAGLNGISGAARSITFAGQTLKSPFGGSFAHSYDRLFSGDFYSWSAGVKLDIPIFWREAAARYRQASAVETKAREDMVRLERDINLEVRTAHNNAESGFARVGTTGDSLTLAERDLAAEVTRYNVGVAQTDDVIRKLNIYAATLTESVRAKTTYLKALADLERASGVTIERKRIELPVPPPLPR